MAKSYEYNVNKYIFEDRKNEILAPLPKFHCGCCEKMKDHRCSVFNRYVDLTHNKCYKHSLYSSVTPDSIDDVLESELFGL